MQFSRDLQPAFFCFLCLLFASDSPVAIFVFQLITLKLFCHENNTDLGPHLIWSVYHQSAVSSSNLICLSSISCFLRAPASYRDTWGSSRALPPHAMLFLQIISFFQDAANLMHSLFYNRSHQSLSKNTSKSPWSHCHMCIVGELCIVGYCLSIAGCHNLAGFFGSCFDQEYFLETHIYVF